jgi:hypothetical protein
LSSIVSFDALHVLFDIGDGKWRKLMTIEVKIKSFDGERRDVS